jgi:hypothetical protein
MRRFLFAVCVCSAPGLAFADGSVAVLPLQSKGGVEPAVVQKAEHALEEAIAEQQDVKAILPTALRKKAKEAPEAVAAQCGASAACLAAYGKRVQATQVLFGIIAAAGRTVTLDFLLVASADDTQQQKTQITVGPAEDVRLKLKAEIARVLGAEVAEMPALQAVMPTKKHQEDEATPALEPIRPATAAEPERRARTLLYLGIVAAAVGAGGLATGAYFGATSRRLGASVNAQTPQTRVSQLEASANQDALIANLGFGIGGGLVALGAALIVLDVVLDLRVKPTLSVSQTGAAASLVLPW